LQSLAMAHGGTLTINPETGLPEAGFLDSILPTLLGGAATFFSGGTITPFMAALGVGGLTALTSKDLGKGLMAGLGAYGGAGIAGGLMNFGEAAIGAEAAKGALPSGIDPVGADAGAYEMGQAAAAKTARAGATNFDRLSRGVTEGFKNPMGAFSAIGGGSKLQGAAMLGAPLLSALSTQDQTSIPTVEQIKFDPRYANINISRQQRPYQPDTGSSGERRYFGDTYVTQYADGGAVPNDRFSYGGGTAAQQQAAIDKIIAERKVLAAATSAAYQRDYPAEFAADPVQKNAARIAAENSGGGGAVPNDRFSYGGGTIDSTYDYSGYGDRSKNSGMRPIAYTEAPKPDFVAADGKTYRYDPVKKSWYVVKEAETKKVNAGVETLMGGSDSGGEGLDGGGSGGGGSGQTGYGNLANLAGEAQRAGFTTIGNFLGGLVPVGAEYNRVDLDTGNKATGTFTAADIAALSGKSDKGSSVSLAADADARQTAKDNADNPTNPNPFGGDVTSSTPNGPSGAPTAPDSGPSSGSESSGGYGEGLGSGYDKASGGYIGHYAQGGLGSLGGYSDGGRLLRGPGDGVSDSIPATVGNRQPARLADGEFVVPARIVSELGNGSTEAGARALYKMMDRIQANRRKTTGKNKVAVNSKSHKYLPA